MSHAEFVRYLLWSVAIGISVHFREYGLAAFYVIGMLAFLANEIVTAIKEIR